MRGINGRTGCRGRGEVGAREPWEPDGLSFSQLVFFSLNVFMWPLQWKIDKNDCWVEYPSQPEALSWQLPSRLQPHVLMDKHCSLHTLPWLCTLSVQVGVFLSCASLLWESGKAGRNTHLWPYLPELCLPCDAKTTDGTIYCGAG